MSQSLASSWMLSSVGAPVTSDSSSGVPARLPAFSPVVLRGELVPLVVPEAAAQQSGVVEEEGHGLHQAVGDASLLQAHAARWEAGLVLVMLSTTRLFQGKEPS